MPRLFALDRNFPQPIVGVLSDFQADATLVPLDRIDTRMSTLDDWELLLALHHHVDPWDGLITTDSSMLAQGPELAALIQTKLTLVVAVASGHNEPVLDFIASRRADGNVDEWGDLDVFSATLTADTLRRLDEEERNAGFAPWQPQS